MIGHLGFRHFFSLFLASSVFSCVFANEAELQAFKAGARAMDDLLGAELNPSAEEAADFLLKTMPTADRERLSVDFLLENVWLALRARSEFSWCAELESAVFLNEVLPYAVLDEERDEWRADFYRRCKPLVKDATSAAEAAQLLNQHFFDEVGVHYSRERNRANQCPSESMVIGKASCTGLSILLVDACRAVGVPARIAGTPSWTTKRGNHTWVEILDKGEWKYTGADEYDAKGLNRGWFAGDAAQADGSRWEHSIWASSWQATGAHWPLVWDLESRSVHGVNVTKRYVPVAAAYDAKGTGKGKRNEIGEMAILRPRVVKDKKRIAVRVQVMDGGASIANVTSFAEPKDWNDVPDLKFPVGRPFLLRLTHGDETKVVPVEAREAQAIGATLVDWDWDALPTTAQVQDSGLAALKTWFAVPAALRSSRLPAVMGQAALDAEAAKTAKAMFAETPAIDADPIESVLAAGKTMKLLERSFGPKSPDGGRSLYISMHGGGGAPPRVNDQQWKNQIRLYEPKEGIVVAPRAPTDTWNLWHQAHIDPLFDALIQTYVARRGVNPDRVYLMGYSAGGDGVYQVAPRMADRFAAASMMAGHPNEASPLGLRNLPFAIFCGGNDGAYKRNEVAAEWGKKLDALAEKDPDGYEHKTTIYEGLGHWMKGRDREALPWMAGFERNPWPKTVVWFQDDVTHDRFYWLQRPDGEAVEQGQEIRATIDGQRILITASEGVNALTLYLGRELLDFDHVVTVKVNGEDAFSGTVQRSVGAMVEAFGSRPDSRMVPEGKIELAW